MVHATDNEIRNRLLANDSSALVLIWESDSSDLLGYLVGILCSQHEVEDALRDVFVPDGAECGDKSDNTHAPTASAFRDLIFPNGGLLVLTNL